MQKKVICMLLALVMLLSLAACGGNGSSEPVKGETVENGTYSGVEKTSDTSFVSDSKSENGYDLTFVCAADQILAEQGKLMNQWIQDLVENNENINSITLIPLGDEERLTTIMAGVGLPDIFFGSAGDAAKYYMAADLLDLSDLFADTSWSDGFYDEAIAGVTVDGKQWAIPFITYISHMYRNLDMMEAANLEIVDQYATMDDLIADFAALTEAGYTATNSWAIGSYYGSAAIIGADVENIDVGKDENGKTTIKAEQLVRSMETLKEIEQYANGMPYGEDATIEAFCAGEIGFLLDGPWTEPTIQAAGVNYDVILIPPYEAGGVTGGMQNWDYFYGIDSGDEGRNEAIKTVLKYLGSYEAEKAWTINVGRATLREDVMKDPDVLQTPMCIAQSAGLDGGIIKLDFFRETTSWLNVFADIGPLVADGTYTPEQAAEAAIDAVNALYEESA